MSTTPGTPDGLDEEPPERWCFRDIRTDSFRWTGEVSRDGRQTWELDEQMLIRRRKDAAAR
jgi:hypothetical protein